MPESMNFEAICLNDIVACAKWQSTRCWIINKYDHKSSCSIGNDLKQEEIIILFSKSHIRDDM